MGSSPVDISGIPPKGQSRCRVMERLKVPQTSVDSRATHVFGEGAKDNTRGACSPLSPIVVDAGERWNRRSDCVRGGAQELDFTILEHAIGDGDQAT